MSKIVLVIDTSLKGAALALAEFEKDAGFRMRGSAMHLDTHAATQSLQSMLRQVLVACQLKVEDLDAVVVGRGPGSFTGIKVGMAFAMGLRLGANKSIPCFGVSALGSLASQSLVNTPLILPANRQQGYFAYASHPQSLEFGIVELNNGLVFMDQERKVIPFKPKGPFLTVNEWDEFAAIAGKAGYEVAKEDISVLLSRALVGMATKAAPDILAGKEPEPLAPFYLRDSAPEEKARAQSIGQS